MQVGYDGMWCVVFYSILGMGRVCMAWDRYLKGRSLLYLCFVGYFEGLAGGLFSEVVCGAVVGSRRGCWAACLGAVPLHGLSVSLPMRVCWCVCGMQSDDNVVPPQNVLQIVASLVCAWG